MEKQKENYHSSMQGEDVKRFDRGRWNVEDDFIAIDFIWAVIARF